MKKILYMLSAALLLIACGEKSGGKESEPALEDLICGEWHSSSVTIDADIYISFSEDKSFELYQKVGEGAYRLYRGKWNIEENILTGKYNDGEDWAASYEVIINDKTLTLTSKNDAAEESTFRKENIPAEVKEGCEVVVKSADAGL